MVFNSLEYMFFLPIVFILYWAIPHKYRGILLLIVSYYFYMSWDPKYIVLIFLTTLVSYVAAILLEKTNSVRNKKRIVLVTLLICLGVLFFFKYFNFFSSTVTQVLLSLAIPMDPLILDILLPVGISFYTFQTLSYVIDVYRGRIKAEHNFCVYAAFISFFPQLASGPIARTENLLPQIKAEHKFEYGKATYGLKLMAWGFFKKMCMADVLAVYVNRVYSNLLSCTGLDLVFVVLAFTVQIYCDFSGYSDIAIGTAKLFGIELMENFRSPYFSSSIKEFWSKWHISLSTWFRDYVYIPLGGNRCGKLKHSMNLLITFLVSGLWHGANWTFCIWGGIHGLAQIIENIFSDGLKKIRNNKVGKFLSVFGVFVFCNVTWVFFRAERLSDALYVIRKMCSGILSGELYFSNTLALSTLQLVRIISCFVLLIIYDYFSLKMDVIKWVSEKSFAFRWTIYLALIGVILFTAQIGESSFIYFQF